MSASPGGYLQAKPGPNNTGTLSIVCPIVTDHVGSNAAGTTIAAINLGRPDQTNTNINCTLFVLDNQTVTPIASKRATFNASSSQFPTQNFAIDVHSGVLGARYHVYCEAPAAGDAKINGIKIQEAP
jgi:hypothetical protein